MTKRHWSAFSIASIIVVGVLLGSAPICRSQVATERTAVKTASGVISDINIDSRLIVLKSKGSEEPTTYTFSKETIFVDSKGNVVSYETFKNSSVTMQYTVEGDRMIVNRVTREDRS